MATFLNSKLKIIPLPKPFQPIQDAQSQPHSQATAQARTSND